MLIILNHTMKGQLRLAEHIRRLSCLINEKSDKYFALITILIVNLLHDNQHIERHTKPTPPVDRKDL